MLWDGLIENIVNSSGIVFLFDPIREFENGDAFAHTFGVLTQLTQRMRDLPGRRLPHYVAVCIAKFDEIQGAGDGGKAGDDRVRNGRPRGFPRVHDEEAQGRSSQSSASVSDSGEAELVPNLLESSFRPERIRYFVTSAIGFYIDPNSANLRPQRLPEPPSGRRRREPRESAGPFTRSTWWSQSYGSVRASRGNRGSDAAMNSGTVPVTADWALWGKESHDAGYRLLEYSDGPVPGDTFVEVLNRYSPGTLEDLPQVTVSWLRDHAQRNYVAIAIHDTEHGRYDAGGRQIVFTRYFCVRYEELAAGAVSYHSMYRELGKSRLGVNSRSRIKAELPRFSAAPAGPAPRALAAAPQPGTPASGLAIRVAALLLTGQPVCILGANRIALDMRLRFLDEVMSLLPYGMRSRLSASTWVSSTFQEHKLRLFFASARRQADDHVVTWDRPDPAPIRHRYADDYLSWLINGVHEPAALLAGVNEQMGFGQADIAMMLERLHVSYSEPPAPLIRMYRPNGPRLNCSRCRLSWPARPGA